MIAVDGKSVRGTFARTGGAGVHLLAALTHQHGTVLGQRLVPVGTSYVFTVKANQHRLHARLQTLPWPQGHHHTATSIGHGRLEHRMIEVLPAPPDLAFPHAAQAFQVTRYRTHRRQTRRTTPTIDIHTAYGLTSLTPQQATPTQIAHYLRGHWEIENRLHWVRDVTYAEDHSRIRTATTPRTMASLRNLAISALRLAGHHNIAAALRHMARHPTRPLHLLGIHP